MFLEIFFYLGHFKPLCNADNGDDDDDDDDDDVMLTGGDVVTVLCRKWVG